MDIWWSRWLIVCILFIILDFSSKQKTDNKSFFNHHDNYVLRQIFPYNNFVCGMEINLEFETKINVMNVITYFLFLSYFLACNTLVKRKKPNPYLLSTISSSFTLPNIQTLFFPGLFLSPSIKFQLFLRLLPLWEIEA